MFCIQNVRMNVLNYYCCFLSFTPFCEWGRLLSMWKITCFTNENSAVRATWLRPYKKARVELQNTSSLQPHCRNISGRWAKAHLWTNNGVLCGLLQRYRNIVALPRLYVWPAGWSVMVTEIMTSSELRGYRPTAISILNVKNHWRLFSFAREIFAHHMRNRVERPVTSIKNGGCYDQTSVVSGRKLLFNLVGLL